MIPITTSFVSCSYYVTALCEHIGLLGDSIDLDIESLNDEKISFKWALIQRRIHATYSKVVTVHIDSFEWVDIRCHSAVFIGPSNKHLNFPKGFQFDCVQF